PAPPRRLTARASGAAGRRASGAVPAAVLALLVRLHLGADAVLLRPHLGRVGFAELVRLEHLPQLDLAFAEGDAACPLDGLLLGRRLDAPEARDKLFRLGEGAVGDGPLVARVRDPHAAAARVEAL